jgi:hypothetical protein
MCDIVKTEDPDPWMMQTEQNLHELTLHIKREERKKEKKKFRNRNYRLTFN